MDIRVQQIIDEFNDITNSPENFLSVNEETSDKAKSLLKNIYDFIKEEELKEQCQNTALPKLVVDGVDIEQIWQQVELQNSEILSEDNIINISRLLNTSLTMETNLDKHKKQSDVKTNNKNSEVDSVTKSEQESESNEESDEEESSINNDDDDKSAKSEDELLSEQNSSENEDSNSETPEINKSKDNFKKSVVDDEFFKLGEMENFLNLEEQKMNNLNSKKTFNEYDENEKSSDEESVDLFKNEEFEELEDEDLHLKNPRFKDFFKKQDNNTTPKQKRNKFLEDLEENQNNEEEKAQKSKYEEREEKLKEKIKEIEEKALSEKPWTMKGEITAEKRPLNSLLEEVLEFDHVSRPAPIITEEAAHMLEDVIIQRIKDKAFDDVERKKRFVETPLEFKKKLVLEQEKSKESLAQIYEKEYLQQQEALTADPLKDEEEPKLHKEIKDMGQKLFRQLDALSNFHYTPRPAAPELKVVTNLPAINMEEVAPVTVSDAALLAPEEIKRKQKGELKSKDERTVTDKKRERRKKKIKQKIHAQEKAKREESSKKNIKSNKQNSEKKALKGHNVTKMDESSTELKSVKSSRAFFDKLQEQVKVQINEKTRGKRLKKPKQNFDAKKIKL